jgi:hypothetical protein
VIISFFAEKVNQVSAALKAAFFTTICVFAGRQLLVYSARAREIFILSVSTHAAGVFGEHGFLCRADCGPACAPDFLGVVVGAWNDGCAYHLAADTAGAAAFATFVWRAGLPARQRRAAAVTGVPGIREAQGDNCSASEY